MSEIGRVMKRNIILIPLLGGHLVNRESWKQHLFVILLFSSLLRLTSAGCQICHLSNGFLICLGFHLADIVTSPPLSSSFTFFLSLSTAGCFYFSPLLAVFTFLHC